MNGAGAICTPKCARHDGEESTIWCLDCTSLVCAKCETEQQQHSGHDRTALDNVTFAQQQWRDILDYRRQLRAEIKRMQAYALRLKAKRKSLTESRRAANEELSDIRYMSIFVATLDDAEADKLFNDGTEKLDAEFSKNLNPMTEAKQSFARRSVEGADLLQKLELAIGNCALADALFLRNEIRKFLLAADTPVPLGATLSIELDEAKPELKVVTLLEFQNRIWGDDTGEWANTFGRVLLGTALSTYNTVYVTDHVRNRIIEYTTDGEYLGSPLVAESLLEPWGIAFDPVEEFLYIADKRGRQVVKVDKTGRTIKAMTYEPAREVLGIALAIEIDRYALFQLDNYIRVVRASTGETLYELPGEITPGVPFETPLGTGGIAIDARARLLYVCDHTANKIVVFDLDSGNYLRALGTDAVGYQMNKPYHVTVEPFSGDVVIADQNNEAIVCYDRAGKFIKVTTVPYRPVGISFNHEGNLLALSRISMRFGPASIILQRY